MACFEDGGSFPPPIGLVGLRGRKSGLYPCEISLSGCLNFLSGQAILISKNAEKMY